MHAIGLAAMHPLGLVVMPVPRLFSIRPCLDGRCVRLRPCIAKRRKDKRQSRAGKRTEHEQRHGSRLTHMELGPTHKRRKHSRSRDDTGGLTQVIAGQDATPGKQLPQASNTNADAHRQKCPLGPRAAQGHRAKRRVARHKRKRKEHTHYHITQNAAEPQTHHKRPCNANKNPRAKGISQNANEIRQVHKALKGHCRRRIEEQRREQAGKTRHRNGVDPTHATHCRFVPRDHPIRPL